MGCAVSHCWLGGHYSSLGAFHTPAPSTPLLSQHPHIPQVLHRVQEDHCRFLLVGSSPGQVSLLTIGMPPENLLFFSFLLPFAHCA